jgi:hypothetical protein
MMVGFFLKLISTHISVIPPDLGKKGRWKDLVIRVQSAQNEFEDRRASEMIRNSGGSAVSSF